MEANLSIVSLVVSVVSAGAAVLSWYASKRSADIARDALTSSQEQFRQNAELTKSMFKRQGVIDLHMAWRDVKSIDPNNPVVPDIVRAVNALDLTASLWNHEVIEHEILLQSYWPNFQEIYATLDNWNDSVPALKTSGRKLLTDPVRAAFEQMNRKQLAKTQQTKLPGSAENEQ